MRKLVFLMLAGALLAGCSARIRTAAPAGPPRPVRVALPEDQALAQTLPGAAGVLGLYRIGRDGRVEKDLAASLHREGNCFRIRLRPGIRLQDGRRLDPGTLIHLWQEESARPDSPLRTVFREIERFRVAGASVEICAGDGVANLPRRLAEPSAWPGVRTGIGAGPYSYLPDEGRSVANPDYRPSPRIRELVWSAGPDGEADVQVVYGRPEPVDGMVVRRIPSWDRTWYLEVDPGARWVYDPTFRGWLASRIDRKGMARVLYGEGAEPAGTPAAPPGRRPVSEGASPRLEILWEDSGAEGERIASRLRADLVADRILVVPSEHMPGRAVALHLHHADPVFLDPERNAGLLENGGEPFTVIPLIRQRAYLLTRRGLQGVEAGPAGVLRFEGAWWRP